MSTAAKKPAVTPKSTTSAANKKMFEAYQAKNQLGGGNAYSKNGSGDGVGSGRKSLSELKAMAQEAARDAANLRRQESDYNRRADTVTRQNEFTRQSNLQNDVLREQVSANNRARNDAAWAESRAETRAKQQPTSFGVSRLAASPGSITATLAWQKATGANAPQSMVSVGTKPGSDGRGGGYSSVSYAGSSGGGGGYSTSSSDNYTPKQMLDWQTIAQSQLQRERAEQAATAADKAGEFQSRLQRERSEQGLTSQREGGELQSRLQKERSEQSLTSQREAATSAMERAKFDVEGRSRLQREGADQGRQAQTERAEQALRSQREGIEGQSRLQAERSQQSSKLQAQAAAEAAAKSTSARANAIASFQRFGKGK